MNSDCQLRRGGRGEYAGGLIALIALIAWAVVCPAVAQETLPCGKPAHRTLPPGATHIYKLSPPAGVSVWLQISDVSKHLSGLMRMRLSGPRGEIANTCSGVYQFQGSGGELTLEISRCNEASGGEYTLTLNVVSDSPANCAFPLPCGATPDGTGFKLLGEVDGFLLTLSEGVQATLRINYTQAPSAPRLRLYDPDGQVIPLQGSCGGQISILPTQTGVYTALVSACGLPVREPYRIEYFDPSCPVGPVITTFGTTNAMNDAQQPIDRDALGRPVFNHPFGQGLSLVLEARAGANRRNPGVSPVPYQQGDVLVEPDLQVILSNALGDGNPLICDTFPPDLGGVPATVPFLFQNTPLALDIIHDMGCRFIDGTGQPIARMSSDEACTRSDEGFGFNFVDRGSRLQFCSSIAGSWAFPTGDTTVAARIKDARSGAFGAPREIVVRIGDPTPATFIPTPTATPTVTPTRTATRTRTSTPRPSRTASATATITHTATVTPTGPTATATATQTGPTPTPPPPPCLGDCDMNGRVTIEDIIRIVEIVLGQRPPTDCPAGDLGSDGQIGIPDLVAAVINALQGCRS